MYVCTLCVQCLWNLGEGIRSWNWSCIWWWVLRTEPRVFGKAARGLNHWAIIPSHHDFNVCDRGRRIYIPGFSKIQSFSSECFKVVIFTIYQSLTVIDLSTKMFEFNLNFFQGVMMSKYFALQLFHLECDGGTRHRALSSRGFSLIYTDKGCFSSISLYHSEYWVGPFLSQA